MFLILRQVIVWAVFTLIFILAKPLFMAFNPSVFGEMSTASYLAVIFHGLRLDMAVAAYLTIIPTIISIISIWHKGKLILWLYRIYFLLITFIISTVIILNIVLYAFWRFPMDMTPLFYFTTSPESAAASVSATFIFTVIVIIIGITALLYFLFRRIFNYPYKRATTNKKKIQLTGCEILFLGLLFIPIRGGFTVATLNPGAAYFSSIQSLNHAAVNPAFNLIYSATHQKNLKKIGRYFDKDLANELFSRLRGDLINHPDSVKMLTDQRPDVYVLICESFSSQIMPSLGGEPIATRLDSIAQKGMLWTNFYANGFRTDRGIPAIVSALPSPPVTSVMKLSDVLEKKPSLASILRRTGYDTRYYYGGDINFTNMKGYLVSAGFNKIVGDRDFPLSQRLSKWGVHDGPLFEKVLTELPSASSAPTLTLIQTSSSHEPFEVPATFARYKNMPPAVNAYAYADSVIGNFINKLETTNNGRKKLIVVTGDHWGCYPDTLSNLDKRHRIPLVITGNALNDKARGTYEQFGSQADITPTILHWMGLPIDSFKFGHVLTHDETPHIGVWFDTDNAGIASKDGSATINITTGQTTYSTGDPAMCTLLKAYLQTLYDSLSN